MDAISLWQPWATLIAIGAKQFETRGGSFKPHHLIGRRLAIAATKTQPLEAWDPDGDIEPAIERALERAEIDRFALPQGAIVATVTLIDIFRTEIVAGLISSAEYAFGNYAPGRAAWRLGEIERIEPPIAVRGAQGIWQWDRNAPPGAAPGKRPQPPARQGRLFQEETP